MTDHYELDMEDPEMVIGYLTEVTSTWTHERRTALFRELVAIQAGGEALEFNLERGIMRVEFSAAFMDAIRRHEGSHV